MMVPPDEYGPKQFFDNAPKSPNWLKIHLRRVGLSHGRRMAIKKLRQAHR